VIFLILQIQFFSGNTMLFAIYIFSIGRKMFSWVNLRRISLWGLMLNVAACYVVGCTFFGGCNAVKVCWIGTTATRLLSDWCQCTLNSRWTRPFDVCETTACIVCSWSTVSLEIRSICSPTSEFSDFYSTQSVVSALPDCSRYLHRDHQFIQ